MISLDGDLQTKEYFDDDELTLDDQLEIYSAEWDRFIEAFSLQSLTGAIKATAVGWKVESLTAFDICTSQLLAYSPQVHIGPVNEVRLIGSFVFPEPIYREARVLKLMQRRPGSEDPLGLDHVDFTVEDISATQTVLEAAGVEVVPENNEVHSWLSVRFGQDDRQEAKFVDHNVLDACIAELQEASASIAES